MARGASFESNASVLLKRVGVVAVAAVSLIAASCAPEPGVPDTTITVTAPSVTLTYGDPVPDITPTYSAQPATPATCTTTATQSSPPGTYPTTCEGATDPAKMITYTDGVITIKPAPVKVTASSGTVGLGDPLPAVSPTYEGLRLGATAPSTLATCSTTATTSSPAGSYPTNCAGAADPNYTFTYVDGTLEITRAVVTVTASSGSHTYGEPAPAVTATYAGFKLGETEPATPASCVSASDTNSATGSYVTSCSGAVDPSYTFVYVNGAMAVTQAPLSITASSSSMAQGGASPAIQPIYSGLTSGDTQPSTPPTCSTTAGPASAPGVYPSNCSGAADPNYSISYVPGSVTVSSSTIPVVVTASSATVTYGDPIPTVTPSYSGLGGNPSTPAVCTTTATSGSDVGTYQTSCSGAVLAGHTFSYVTGTITITKAQLSVVASSESMTYGGAVPAVTATYTGLRAGDSAPAAVPTCSTSATSSSPVGSYTSTCVGAADGNYAISYVNGSVAITKAPVVVKASNASFEAGSAVPAITASYTGFLFGEAGPTTPPTCSTDATSASAVGIYASSCAGAGDPNYSFTYQDGVVQVTQPSTPTPSATGYAGYSTITKATTVTAASNGKALPQSAIDVVATAGFVDYTNLTVVSSSGPQTIFCKSSKGNATRFQGCEGGTGTLATGNMITDAAPNTFDVFTIMGGAATLEPSSLVVLQDVPASFRGTAAKVTATPQFGLITSLIAPAATGSFNLTFGICDTGTAIYSAANPACRVGEIVYGPGSTSTMGAPVKVGSGLFSATSNVYQKLHTAVTAPATVKAGQNVTVYAAAAGSAVPKANPSSVGDATINNARNLSIIFPVPAGMEFVSAVAMGGDARTSGQVQIKNCPVAGTAGCNAKLTGNYDQTKFPYVQVSLASGFSVPGGATMTVPTIAFTMKAVGAVGTVANATVTQFNLTTNVNAPIIGNQDAVFEGYPTDDSNPDATPPKRPPTVLRSITIVS